jgi:hypothetical protein
VLRKVGLATVVVAVAGGFAVGNLLSTGGEALSFLAAADPGGTRAAEVGLGLLPLVLLLLLGAALL